MLLFCTLRSCSYYCSRSAQPETPMSVAKLFFRVPVPGRFRGRPFESNLHALTQNGRTLPSIENAGDKIGITAMEYRKQSARTGCFPNRDVIYPNVQKCCCCCRCRTAQFTCRSRSHGRQSRVFFFMVTFLAVPRRASRLPT